MRLREEEGPWISKLYVIGAYRKPETLVHPEYSKMHLTLQSLPGPSNGAAILGLGCLLRVLIRSPKKYYIGVSRYSSKQALCMFCCWFTSHQQPPIRIPEQVQVGSSQTTKQIVRNAGRKKPC